MTDLRPPAAQPPTSVAPPVAPPPPPPAMTAWGTTASPAPATKRSPKVIIGAAVAGVALLGGLFSVANLVSVDDKPPLDPSDVLVPAIDPGKGPAPAPPVTPVTTPGPTPPPTVTTTIAPTPKPTIPPARPDDPETASTTHQILGNIAVMVPDGWEVQNASEGSVLLGMSGAQVRVLAQRGIDGDARQLVTSWISSNQELQNVALTAEGDAPLPSSNVVSAYSAAYEGILATQQGALPLEAMVFAFQTQDGVAVLLETTNVQGDFDLHKSDYQSVLQSLADTL